MAWNEREVRRRLSRMTERQLRDTLERVVSTIWPYEDVDAPFDADMGEHLMNDLQAVGLDPGRLPGRREQDFQVDVDVQRGPVGFRGTTRFRQDLFIGDGATRAAAIQRVKARMEQVFPSYRFHVGR